MGGRRPTGLARSATRRRSIGNQSAFSETTNGDADTDAGADDDIQSNGAPSRTWTIYQEDGDNHADRGTEHEDPDDPINKYVKDQLRRIESNESQEYAEELTAQTDGAGDEQ